MRPIPLALLVVVAASPALAVAQPQSLPAPAAPSQSITPAPRGSDTCGATAMASLIGQSRSAIPIPVDPSKRRVVCTTCPRTMDYRPDRLTIFYETRTGRVTTLQCG